MAKKKTKLPPRKFRKLVQDAAQEYRWILHCENMSFRTAWMDEDIEREGDMLVAAHIEVDTTYLSAYMKIYPFVWKEWIEGSKTDADVEKIVAHEIAHMATQQMINLLHRPFLSQKEAEEAWESLTETIGRLIYRLDTRKKK